jgi:D-3-phosphoglycerate dehydrogenase / 2-oxoglutarate reductase
MKGGPAGETGTPQVCLVLQPIHPDGLASLRRAGVEPVAASAADMATVAGEIGGAVAVITRSAGLSRAAIDAAPALRVIGSHGIGVDRVDVEHATALGIPVVHTPDTNVESVAELAVALALAVAKRLVPADRAARAGDAGFKYVAPLRELAGKTLGIVGFGRIGRRTAEMFTRAFRMRLLVHDPHAPPGAVEALGGIACGTLEELLAQSDVVSLHVPLRPSTRGMIDARRLALMRPSAILINTARGAVVDEAALVAALRAGRLAGAGLDVVAAESLRPDDPLAALDDVVLTPHIGGSSDEAARRTALSVAAQVLDVLHDRRPDHLVDADMWSRRRR